MSDRPGIAQLLPHAGAMRLLRRVIHHAADRTVCEALASQAHLFREADGQIPGWVAIEWMAQCAGVHFALELCARGETPGLGFLTGGPEIRLLVPCVPGDATVRIEAVPEGSGGGLHAFLCRTTLSDGKPLAEARLRIFVPGPAPTVVEAP